MSPRSPSWRVLALMNESFTTVHQHSANLVRSIGLLFCASIGACEGADAQQDADRDVREAYDTPQNTVQAADSERTAAPRAQQTEGTPPVGAEPLLPPPRAEGGPAAVGSCAGDPLATLRKYAPTDKKLAADYEKYITKEVGPLTCATSGGGGKRTIKQTIFVPPNTEYDGKGETLTADTAAMLCDTSDGEQDEGQRPYFLLAPGARLKNVTITYPGCEGVHMMGDNVLDNLRWPDAGEDAASVRSYFPGGKISILNSEGHKAADKMFQFNAPCDVRIANFTGSDMGKLVRQNGGKDFPLKIDLNNVTVTGVISAVVQSDSPQCFVRHQRLSYQFKGSGDKSDRAFKGIPKGNVTAY